MNNYLWDSNFVRYRLINSINNNSIAYNWLFFPGGPGADSSYLHDLAKGLNLPGNTWLIDLPNNGTNHINKDYHFDQWFEIFLPIIKQFQNPILVGQSFGGMFPLLFPQLETILRGFVILNSSPTLWHTEALRIAEEKQKPPYMESLKKFMDIPNTETFKQVLVTCAPYYFPAQSLDKGKKLLENLPLNFHASGWWQQKAVDLNFDAAWIPKNVPTLIIGGTEDCITPPTLFLNDKRFHRDNISLVTIENAGHMPWLEDLAAVEQAFYDFIKLLTKNSSP